MSCHHMLRYIRYAVKEQLFRIKRSVAPDVAFESGIVYKYLSPKKDLRKR